MPSPTIQHRLCTGALRRHQPGVIETPMMCLQCLRYRERGPWDVLGAQHVTRYADGAVSCRLYLHDGGSALTVRGAP